MPKESGSRGRGAGNDSKRGRNKKGQGRKREKNLSESPPQQKMELDEPSYPCGTCGKEVNDNDDAILCESGCNVWFHRVCTGLSESAYSYLTSEDNAEWVCDNCYSSLSMPLSKPKTAD